MAEDINMISVNTMLSSKGDRKMKLGIVPNWYIIGTWGLEKMKLL